MVKPNIYKISKEIVDKNQPRNYKGLANYVLETYPDIKRGDLLKLDKSLSSSGRSSYILFWDGKRVIPQCFDYSDGYEGGPPLCFKTFTEFPINYFEKLIRFDSTVYLDYDTFSDQVRNWLNGKSDEEDEDEYQEFDLCITYNGNSYLLEQDEAYDNFKGTYEYVKFIHEGLSTKIILVDSCNKIVDIDGYQVYYHDN